MMRRKGERHCLLRRRRIICRIGNGRECNYRHLLQAHEIAVNLLAEHPAIHVYLAIAGESPAPARDGLATSTSLSATGRLTCAGFPIALLGPTIGSGSDGISNHKKLLDSNANFEEFEVDNPEKHLHIKAQTLRLYNPDTRQWSIYLLDLDKGVLSTPPVVGEFNGNRGEFYDRNNIKAARFWCATSGQISRRNLRAWNSPFRLTAGRRGRQTGSAN